MAHTKLTEREMELHSDLAFAIELPDRRDVAGRAVRKPTQELGTIYSDTPDFRLWERAIIVDTRQKTLRRRWRSSWTARNNKNVLRWLKK
jgi:hypothetical protein